MEDKIYVQNAYRSAIQINLKDERGMVTEAVIFKAYSVDRMSGRVTSDGFTVLSKETYEKLQSNPSFNKLVQTNKLIVHETAPASAMSNVDRILALQEDLRVAQDENVALKARIAELEKQLKKDEEPAQEPTQEPAKDEEPAQEPAQEPADKPAKGKNANK